MFPRGAKAAAGSQKGLDMMFVDGTPTKLIMFFKAMSIASTVAKPFQRLFASKKGK